MYMDPDPNVVNEYVGAVYVCVESHHNSCIQRAQGIRSTRFETKNDPAWHYKDTEQYEILRVVSNDVIQSSVHSVNDLKLKNAKGELLSQDKVNLFIEYLNGAKAIGKISSKNTHGRNQQQQKFITKKTNRDSDKDIHREIILHLNLLDKVMLHKIQLANYLQSFGVALFFVSTGTGPLSVDMRKTAALQAPIPVGLLQTNMERFKEIQEHFMLLKTGKTNPIYMDFLDDNANIFHITFKPQQGNAFSYLIESLFIEP